VVQAASAAFLGSLGSTTPGIADMRANRASSFGYLPEAGSYSKRIDLVYQSTLGLRVIKKREKEVPSSDILSQF